MRILPVFVAALALAAAPAMARPVTFASTLPSDAAVVIPLGSETDLDRAAASLDAATREAVRRALRTADFDYKPASTLSLRGLGTHPLILVVGTQDPENPASRLERAGGAAAAATASHDGPVALLGYSLAPDDAAAFALGAALRNYRFDRLKSSDPAKPAKTGRDAPLTVIGAGDARAAWAQRGEAMVEALDLTRNLINEPANVIYPESFVERAREAFAGMSNVTVQVLDVAEMQRLGMGSLLAVGQGSQRPPRLLVLHYRGAGGQPLALVGKGITFDTGGLSLKPGAGMWRMKGDMAGAATVVGTVLSLAKSRAPVNVVAVAALAENMPSGTATRPGDVVRAMNGKTIEILNTDAEGRLVLADAVAYAEQTFRPSAIVDVATLTGAKVTALGDEYAALFSRHDELARQIESASARTGELVWRLPLHPSYAKDVSSTYADLRNSAEGGGAPGAGFGAHFIGEFVTPATPWAHLDVAGSTLSESAGPLSPEGATGYGVRLLDQFARDFRPVAR